MYGLVYKCSTACLKVRRVLCARAPCPALDRRGESAYVISVLHEYMLFSRRSLFLHPPVCFFLYVFLKNYFNFCYFFLATCPDFPPLPPIHLSPMLFAFFFSSLIASPGHPQQLTPLDNGRLTRLTVAYLCLCFTWSAKCRNRTI